MRSVGAVIFPGFQSLDLYGPLDMFGMLPDELRIETVAASMEPVASTQGPRTLPDATFADGGSYSIVLIPGGPGTRTLVGDTAMVDAVRRLCESAEIVSTVCTGSALLARAGLLDGRRATTNKAAFAWVQEQGPKVDWQRKARWVVDGNIHTSSGVSAGMDMALALIASLYGVDRARQAATRSEYRWVEDSEDDPFADIHR